MGSGLSRTSETRAPSACRRGLSSLATQGHVSLADRRTIADEQPAFLDLRPLAADVAGVDGDVQAVERQPIGCGRQIRRAPPIPRSGRGGSFVRGKTQVENLRVRRAASEDAGFVFIDFNVSPPCAANRENFGEKSLEIAAGDGFLKNLQPCPVRHFAEHRERGGNRRRAGWLRRGQSWRFGRRRDFTGHGAGGKRWRRFGERWRRDFFHRQINPHRQQQREGDQQGKGAFEERGHVGGWRSDKCLR
jgi:hypothetical protein